MFLFLKKIWRGLLFLLSVVAIVIFATQSYSRNNDSTSYVQTSDAKMVQTYNSERQPVMVSIERIPERVIANRINCEETLIALGVENRIVAVNMQNTDWQKEYLPQYRGTAERLKPITFRNLSLEEAMSLNPDCIIGWKSTFTPKSLGTTDFWKSRNVIIYIAATSNRVKNYAGVEDECQYILDMGKIFGKEEKAKEIVDKIHRKITGIQERIQGKNHLTVMVIEFQGHAIVNYGKEWLIGDMISQLGGRLPWKSDRLDYESLLVLNPDVIFVVYFNGDDTLNVNKLLTDPRFNSLDAVKNHRVYPLRLDYMYTTAVRTVEGLEILKNGMYPELK